MVAAIKQFSIYWCDLKPTFGHQINKTRPCVVISPDDLNVRLGTVIVVPLTRRMRNSPFYLQINYQDQPSSIACDQIRAIDKRRVGDHYANLTQTDATRLSGLYAIMFAVE